MLPERDEAAEDAFVASWADTDDLESLAEVVEAAIVARRPRLAARLFGLVEDRVDIEPGSALDRARRAARLLLVPQPEPQVWDDLEDAWREVRRRRMARIKERMRAAARGDHRRISRVSRRRR